VKIYKIAMLTEDVEDVYYDLKKALDYLDEDFMSKAKIEIKKAIKSIEKIRPHLKDKKTVIPDTFKWRERDKYLAK